MKKIVVLFIVSLFLFSNCCIPVRSLKNERKSDIDTYVNERDFSGLYFLDKNRYKYTNDSLESRFHYYIFIPKEISTIKLNSFILTRKKDKDTIPCVLYYKYVDLSLNAVVEDIHNLPFYMNETEREQVKGGMWIIAECSEPYVKVNKIYVSYDIEVGNEHIVKKNIEYKRRLEFDCRPK